MAIAEDCIDGVASTTVRSACDGQACYAYEANLAGLLEVAQRGNCFADYLIEIAEFLCRVL